MYKVASDRKMTALHRGRPADWANGQEQATDQSRLFDMHRAIQALDERIKSLPKGSDERRKLGQQKLEWQNELRELNKKAKEGNLAQRGIGDFFIDIAREQLAPATFKGIWAAAKRVHLQEIERADQQREIASITAGHAPAARQPEQEP